MRVKPSSLPPAVAELHLVRRIRPACNQTNPSKTISCCSETIRRKRPRNCSSDLKRLRLPSARDQEGLFLSRGRRSRWILASIQRGPAKLLRFSATFSAMACPIMTRLSFATIVTSNQALERTADRRENLLSMTSTVSPKAQLALVSGRSASSR